MTTVNYEADIVAWASEQRELASPVWLYFFVIFSSGSINQRACSRQACGIHTILGDKDTKGAY